MRKIKGYLLCLSVLFLLVTFSYSTGYSQAYWQAMAPYNVLWPTWPSVLNSYDWLTGQNYPLVSSIYSTTQLPVQPSWVWNPSLNYPYFLYNAPASLGGSVYYFDALTGFAPWSNMSILTPPATYYFSIPPFSSLQFSGYNTDANLGYATATSGIVDAISYTSLLTGSTLWGTPPF